MSETYVIGSELLPIQLSSKLIRIANEVSLNSVTTSFENTIEVSAYENKNLNVTLDPEGGNIVARITLFTSKNGLHFTQLGSAFDLSYLNNNENLEVDFLLNNDYSFLKIRVENTSATPGAQWFKLTAVLLGGK